MSYAHPLEVHLFDFDGTLFRSPDRPDWWKDEGSWFGNVVSLSEPCVPDRPGSDWWVSVPVQAAAAAIKCQDCYTLCATGRLDRYFRGRVVGLLWDKGLHFDEIHLNPGKSTSAFKQELLLRTLTRLPPEVRKVVVWDNETDKLQDYERFIRSLGLEAEMHLVSTTPQTVQCGKADVPRPFYVAARWSARLAADGVIPFRPRTPKQPPKPHGPTEKILGRAYYLSTYRGSAFAGLEEPREEGEGARLIKLPGPENPWSYLWVLDTSDQTVAMWNVHEGNLKVHCPRASCLDEVHHVRGLGHLNEVDRHEFEALWHEMVRREGALHERLTRSIREMEDAHQKQVNALVREFFDEHVKGPLLRSMRAVREGTTPLGFKFLPALAEHGKDRTEQALTHVISQAMSKDMALPKVERFIESKGVDLSKGDSQATQWAVQELWEHVYDELLHGGRCSSSRWGPRT